MLPLLHLCSVLHCYYYTSTFTFFLPNLSQWKSGQYDTVLQCTYSTLAPWLLPRLSLLAQLQLCQHSLLESNQLSLLQIYDDVDVRIDDMFVKAFQHGVLHPVLTRTYHGRGMSCYVVSYIYHKISFTSKMTYSKTKQNQSINSFYDQIEGLPSVICFCQSFVLPVRQALSKNNNELVSVLSILSWQAQVYPNQ